MVASSPVRHDSQMPQGSQVEVQSYQQPPWKALSDFALQSDIEQPPFQQLVRVQSLFYDQCCHYNYCTRAH